MNRDHIHSLRENYTQGNLDRSDLLNDPLSQFRKWFDAALSFGIKEPNAMILSTVDSNNCPDARTVLMKDLSSNGISFYTNLESSKALDIKANPMVALTFLWLEMERQVRVQGEATIIDEKSATKYYQSRPKDSQIGAWASAQSKVLSDRKILEDKVTSLQQQYIDSDVLPKPPFWGGYIVRPIKVEFWQGRASRLHDRFQYEGDTNGKWEIVRLNP